MQYFTQIGLVSDICGTIGLFLYGLPSRVKSTEGAFLIADDLEEKRLNEVKKFNKQLLVKARLSLALLIMGFIFQFIGSLCRN